MENPFSLGIWAVVLLNCLVQGETSVALRQLGEGNNIRLERFFGLNKCTWSGKQLLDPFPACVSHPSVAQSCPTLCDPMNCSTPGLPVHHHLLEFTQTHIHRVSDAIQPSHPLSSPSPPAPNPSQHQGLFQWVNSSWGGQSIGVSALASVLPVNTQGWSPLERTGWISLQSRGLSL